MCKIYFFGPIFGATATSLLGWHAFPSLSDNPPTTHSIRACYIHLHLCTIIRTRKCSNYIIIPYMDPTGKTKGLRTDASYQDHPSWNGFIQPKGCIHGNSSLIQLIHWHHPVSFRYFDAFSRSSTSNFRHQLGIEICLFDIEN